MDDRYTINAAKTEIREGYNTGSVDRILAQLSPGYTDLSDGFPSCARDEARAVLRARLDVLFAENQVEFAPITADINLLATTALVYGWHHMTLIPKSGVSRIQRRTRFVEIWQRLDAGWKLGLLIDNTDPSPTLASETVAALLDGALDPLTGKSRKLEKLSRDTVE